MAKAVGLAISEDELRRAWDERERQFPKFTRMKWESATALARAAFIQGYQRNIGSLSLGDNGRFC